MFTRLQCTRRAGHTSSSAWRWRWRGGALSLRHTSLPLRPTPRPATHGRRFLLRQGPRCTVADGRQLCKLTMSSPLAVSGITATPSPMDLHPRCLAVSCTTTTSSLSPVPRPHRHLWTTLTTSSPSPVSRPHRHQWTYTDYKSTSPLAVSSEFRSCVKVEVAVLGSPPNEPYGFRGRKATLNHA